MKLSGHNYNNNVFSSLIDGLNDRIIVKEASKKSESPNFDMNFTKITQDTFNKIMDEDLKFIAQELVYAAQNAKVAVSEEDLHKFATEAYNKKLKGKNLEREARKFCSALNREVAEPIGTTKISNIDSFVERAKVGTVIPAGSKDGEMNHGRSAYLGQSKNPNTIWNNEALSKMAQKPEDHVDLFGDEQIAKSKQAKTDFAYNQKLSMWKQVQNECLDKTSSTSKVLDTHTVESQSFNPKNPVNSMSIFSNDRDFNNIPEVSEGEKIKNKTAQIKENEVSKQKVADNTLSFAFEKHQNNSSHSNTQREATDKMFDGLANLLNKG